MRGWRPTVFEVGTAARAARRVKWALSALLGALLLEMLVLELPGRVVPAQPDWLAVVLVGGTVVIDLALCVLVLGTALEYTAWVRQAIGSADGS